MAATTSPSKLLWIKLGGGAKRTNKRKNIEIKILEDIVIKITRFEFGFGEEDVVKIEG